MRSLWSGEVEGGQSDHEVKSHGPQYPAQGTSPVQLEQATTGTVPPTDVPEGLATVLTPMEQKTDVTTMGLSGILDSKNLKEMEDRTGEEVARDIGGHGRHNAAGAEALKAKLRSDTTSSTTVGANDLEENLKETGQLLRKNLFPPPTHLTAELLAMRVRLSYGDGLFHCAIAGFGGCGKSSLVNALRGLRNGDKGAAATGTTEASNLVARFPDPGSKGRLVWYDIPGAGMQAASNSQYLTQYGLYTFDCIVVVFDTRLAAMDVTLLRYAAQHSISTFVVRSKSRQHIRNLAADIASDHDDNSDTLKPNSRNRDAGARLVLEKARQLYIQQTEASVARIFAEVGMHERRVYLVDKDVLVKVVKGELVEDAIDEPDLLRDLQAEAARHFASEVGASGSV